MDLREAGWLLFGLLFASGLARGRMEEAVTAAFRRASPHGAVRTASTPHGPLGEFVLRSDGVVVSGAGVRFDALPLEAGSAGGPGASVGLFRIALADANLAGIPVRSLAAEMPAVRVDPGALMRDARLKVRASGRGSARATIAEEALAGLVTARMPALKEASVIVTPVAVEVRGLLSLFGAGYRVCAVLAPRVNQAGDLCFDVVSASMNGAPAAQVIVRTVEAAMNPALSPARDLSIGVPLRLHAVTLGPGRLTIEAEIAPLSAAVGK